MRWRSASNRLVVQVVIPVLAWSVLAASPVEAAGPAELIVINANVITVDHDQPRAQAFAVAGGRFTVVGSNAQVRAASDDKTRVIDATGLTIIPGFNDAHLHPRPLYSDASPHSSVDCSPAAVSSIAAMVGALRKKAENTPAGQWIRGSRYQETKLGRQPTRYDLDRVSKRHPIRVSHSSGHVRVFNSYALRLAKVTRDTADPPGGRFDRDQHGVPNGVCRENAAAIVRDAGPDDPRPTTEEKVQGLLARFRLYAARGITSVQDAGNNSMSKLMLYDAARAAGQPLRVYLMLSRYELSKLVQLKAAQQLGDDRLKLGAIKRFHGNSLSGQTCWLYEPYADRPDYFGIPPRRSQDYLDARILEIHQAGLQACVHANGDREIDMVLNAIQRAVQRAPDIAHRHRIEHCSVVNERILGRIKSLGVVIAPHSYVYEHGDKMQAYGEQRWNMMHPNRSAIELGIVVAGTSDSPVSAADPLLRIQSMVTRTSAEGQVYGPRQKVTVEQAIRCWTLGSAHAAFDEKIKGSITQGKLADFVMLAADPAEVPPHTIKDITVVRTVVGGKTVYRDPGRGSADPSQSHGLR